jgi:hypothetical protein
MSLVWDPHVPPEGKERIRRLVAEGHVIEREAVPQTARLVRIDFGEGEEIWMTNKDQAPDPFEKTIPGAQLLLENGAPFRDVKNLKNRGFSLVSIIISS